MGFQVLSFPIAEGRFYLGMLFRAGIELKK